MRKCLRCENEMVENLEVMVTNGGYGIDVREKGMFKNAIEKIKCAACPECGYVETYIENTDKVKNLINKEEVKIKKDNLESSNIKEVNIKDAETNSLTLIGNVIGEKKLSYEENGEKFYSFNLSIPRLSENADIIPVTISEHLISDEILLEGRKLLIKGQFISYNIYENGRNKLKVTAFAKEVEEKQESEIVREYEITNEIELIGCICKKPIYRRTPFGRDITDLLLAVTREENETDYIPAIDMGRNAIFCQNLEVGAQVKIIGRIQSREYEKRYEDGTTEKRVAYEVLISSIELINIKG